MEPQPITQQFNNLNNKKVKRSRLEALAAQALADGAIHIYNRITTVLSSHPDVKEFAISLTPCDDEADFCGISYTPSYVDPEEIGLAKGVSPDEIYEYITKIIIETIEVSGHLPWQRTWDKGVTIWDGKQAVNYDSKKPYRGINYWFTNFKIVLEKGKRKLVPRDLTNPYFLTFNQIKKHKGALKKDSKGIRVFYFTKLYSHTEVLPGGKKLSISTYDKNKYITWLKKNQARIKILKSKMYTIERLANSYIPILKYYNVFHGADVTGIKWDTFKENKNPKLPTKERIQIAENIIKAMPNAPEIIFKGNQPAYYPSFDHVRMTPIEAFKSEQEHYATLFHELVHSTGHTSRLNRFTEAKSTKREYAFEELIAEMGAVFLCAESGILFSVINNSASYLAGWNKRLVGTLKKDNRYFFRASSKAQAATDYILHRDKDGVPAYLKIKPIKKAVAVTPKKKPQKPTTPKPTAPKKPKQLQLALSKPAIAPSGFVIASETPQTNTDDTFRLKGGIGDFLQDLQRYRCAIVLTGDPHAGKSEVVAQIADAFLEYGFKGGYFDLEHGGLQSKDTRASFDRNIKPSNLKNLAVTGEAPEGIETVRKHAGNFDFIVIDSFQELDCNIKEFNALKKQYPNTIWIIIFQQNGTGGTRGGIKADYDTPIKIKVHKVDDSFVNNYAELQKSRGNDIGLKYNIASKKGVRDAEMPLEPKIIPTTTTVPDTFLIID